MKFTVTVPELAAAVAWVSRSISTSPTLPTLGGMLLDLADHRLRVAGTDLERTGEASVEVAGSGDGRIVVPGRIFADILGTLPAGLGEFAAEAGTLKVACGQVTHELRLLDVGDFPTLAEPSLERTTTLPGASLAAAAAQVIPATTTDLVTRPALAGVLLEVDSAQLTLAATDSYRLAVRELPCDWPHEPALALVPARGLGEAARVMAGENTVTVAVEAHQVNFAGGTCRLTARLIEAEFPPWRPLIPTGYERTATVDRQALLDALKQVRPYSANDAPVRLSFTPGRLDVDGTQPDVGHGHSAVDATYQADTMTVAFNPAFLADGVAGVAAAKVVIELGDGLRPALVHAPEQDDYLYLLMPVRLP